MEVKDILKQRRIELDLTMKEVADRVGVSEGTISRWESGEIANMRRDKIMALADALKISPSIIMGWGELSEQTNIRHAVTIKVLGRVAAGIPIEAIEDIIDTEEITEEMAKTGRFFGLRIKGDSMEPKISDGDIVIVRQQDDADSGNIVIATINGHEATCKRLRKYRDGIELISTNPSYEPMFFSNKEIETMPVRIIGRVIELRAKL